MAELGMNALLGVARGGEEPPKLIFLEYRHPDAERTVALVGKGVTFDSGGISLKPAGKMHEMKYDMCGAAAVLCTLMAVTHLKPAVNVVGVIPAVTNMPDGRAQTPGDIVRAYNGKTIEVQNTDAEGRLILADAMAYAVEQYKPDCLVDIATLTGAVVIALGHFAAGVLGTDENTIAQLTQVGEQTGERLWPLPLWRDYEKLMEGEHADLVNVGPERQAGTITGAAFLKNFVGDTPWVHIDIAGVAYGVKHISYLSSKYATGFGVRLFIRWLQLLAEQH
jgi:leucyl aminopeptidase